MISVNKTSAAARVVAVKEGDRARATRATGFHRALWLPLAFIVGFTAMSALPSVRANGRLAGAFMGSAACLVAWYVGLMANAIRHGRTLTVKADLRKQHYLQACAQGTVLLYWGFYWREVYHSAHLIAAQLLFAYAFDILLSWSRRDEYALGFSPFPVIFSINLFLWFKPDWFYFQFLLVAVGFAAKELIRWEKDGRRVHVFNPSSFPLGVVSLVLLLTASTDMTWGYEIATTLNNAPHIYLLIFLVGLPGQFLFGVTTMTMTAVVTMYAFGLLYFALTGTYYFVDSYIPIAVFLGMHLLFTDPSTSPRSEFGRVIFGALYALSVVALYALLTRLGTPTFYDKLMARTDAQPGHQSHRSICAVGTIGAVRSRGACQRARRTTAKSCVYRRLELRVPCHECLPGRWRHAPRAVGAVLVDGVRREPATWVSQCGCAGFRVLSRRIGMGLQRVWHPDSARSAARSGLARVRARVRAGIRGRMRQSRSASCRKPAAGPPWRRRLSHCAAGPKRKPPGLDTARASPAGVYSGVSRWMPPGLC